MADKSDSTSPRTMDADNTTKLPMIAELTCDNFRVLFKELFAESMDENMTKINCKLGELKD